MPKAAKPRAVPPTRANPFTRNANPKQPSSKPGPKAPQKSVSEQTMEQKKNLAKDAAPGPSAGAEQGEASSKVASNNANAGNSYTLPSDGSNYLVQVRLENVEDPFVSRLLSVPPTFTFKELHEVLQIAFHWAGYHAHNFHVWSSSFKGMMLDGIPATKDLVRIEPEMNIFEGDDDDDKPVMEEDLTLGAVYEDPRWQGKAVIGYTYDHGDGWAHTFVLLGRASPDINVQMSAPEGLKILCLGGEGHHVAEDCGGPDGWDDLKDRFRKGKRADPDDLRGWYDRDCGNGGDGKKFDKHSWDIFEVNRRLAAKFAPEVLGNAARKA